ncbi:MAG: hypothetical protein UU51_C0003G0017 [Microgenomates group bacterium GW2011_GWC1_41_20]|uniref:Uncharacterized protein n=4 Tax=Candidatus Woeseibacteriota TaxID=1752722 RepID=A0A0G0QN07_9BACT|nr:MAG: hypothetical protein UT76_C0030G0010 [Candidatus Woesebacteria bacterium GW2011_GWB1_40_12]KKS00669.1 MAG: hypothetical protein UU51_C0003G0017 [Microgenomates group bacterium GW2011_GWC1_41_20]KKS05231.1 MAG: hypothetical protein UU57_C0014G0005 [Candidatus Woesebacteria bacterium GW2011_GWE1_41_24]KKS16724.1 MAG: hypothetical protein UU74_C0034G0010 [Candidatus Woesebacteria bacterium GW2011_GWA1_41_7]
MPGFLTLKVSIIKIRVMRKELENELDPINMIESDFVWKAHNRLRQNRGKVLPVFVKSHDAKEERGSFYMRLVMDNEITYMQAEEFSSTELARDFPKLYERWGWKELQPNIYRLNTAKAF